MTVSSIAELERLLRGGREAGGYRQFVVAAPDDIRYEVTGVECPGNGAPLLIRIASIGDPQ